MLITNQAKFPDVTFWTEDKWNYQFGKLGKANIWQIGVDDGGQPVVCKEPMIACKFEDQPVFAIPLWELLKHSQEPLMPFIADATST